MAREKNRGQPNHALVCRTQTSHQSFPILLPLLCCICRGPPPPSGQQPSITVTWGARGILLPPLTTRPGVWGYPPLGPPPAVFTHFTNISLALASPRGTFIACF